MKELGDFMNKKITSFFLLLVNFFLLFSPANGFIAVDCEEISEGKTRVVAIDISEQKLLLYKEARQISDEPLNGYLLSLTSLGSVSIQKQKSGDIKPIIIRSKGSVSGYEGWQYTTLGSHKIYSSEIITPKSPQEITAILPEPKVREPAGESFVISKKGDKHVSTLATLSNENKGHLGELAATLTMLSFGYSQHLSKYGGDNGFDGVFQSWNQEYLWLTESKQECKQRTAENIMKHFLNENKIWDTIKQMTNAGSYEVKQTANLIKTYLSERSQFIYKLAYRLMDKGNAQCKVDQLKLAELPPEAIKQLNIPLSDKIRLFQTVLKGFEEAPEKQFNLALNAISLTSIPKEQVLNLVAHMYDEQTKIVTNGIQTHKTFTLQQKVQSQSIIPPIQSLLPKLEVQNIEVLPTAKLTKGSEGFNMQGIQPLFSPLPIKTELPKVEVTLEKNMEMLQLDPENNANQLYNRANLTRFLNHLTSKEIYTSTISTKLKGEKDMSDSTLRRLKKEGVEMHAPTKEYEHVWDALVANYPEEFKDWSQK